MRAGFTAIPGRGDGGRGSAGAGGKSCLAALCRILSMLIFIFRVWVWVRVKFRVKVKAGFVIGIIGEGLSRRFIVCGGFLFSL